MVLSEEQVQKLLKEPKNRKAIAQARRHEERILFHSEVADRKEDIPYYDDFILKVSNILLDQRKVATFESLLEMPFRTVAINNRIQDIQKKVFESQDSYLELSARQPEQAQDLSEYLDAIGESQFWEEEGFTRRYGECNRLLVVDTQPRQGEQAPRPFFYTVGFHQVHDMELEGQEIAYVIFKTGEKERFVIDGSGYRRYEQDQQGNWNLTTEGTHDLPYCPVHFVVSTPLNERVNPLTRWAATSPVIGTMDRYLFMYTAKNNYELLGAMPPWWTYETQTSCEDPACDNGQLTVEIGNETKIVECKDCKNRKDAQSMLRAGGIYIVPAPADSQDADLRDPIGKVDADRGALDFNSLNVDKLADVIIQSVTGVTSNIVGQEAINEKQVKAQLDSERGSLLFLAKDIAITRKWLVDTLGRLRLGDGYLGSTVNMGTDFFLLSELQEINEYNQLRTSGLSRHMLMVKQDQIRQRMMKGKPRLQQRSLILEAIEPLTQSSVAECQQLYATGLLSTDDLLVKIHFADLVRQFEYEYGDLVEYRRSSPFTERVEDIKTKLYNYGKSKKSALGQGFGPGIGGQGGPQAVPQSQPDGGSGGAVAGVQG
jgi:hypothetical protein